MAIFTDQSRLPYTLKCAAFSLHLFCFFRRWMALHYSAVSLFFLFTLQCCSFLDVKCLSGSAIYSFRWWTVTNSDNACFHTTFTHCYFPKMLDGCVNALPRPFSIFGARVRLPYTQRCGMSLRRVKDEICHPRNINLMQLGIKMKVRENVFRLWKERSVLYRTVPVLQTKNKWVIWKGWKVITLPLFQIQF